MRNRIVNCQLNRVIGGVIRDLREARGISQTTLGARADVPLCTVSLIELGKMNCSMACFLRLCKGLNESPMGTFMKILEKK